MTKIMILCWDMQIESLKQYLSDQVEFTKLAEQICHVAAVRSDYPDYLDWFYHKQLAGIGGPERNILFARNPQTMDEIVAVANLKKDNVERKICTLYVDQAHRGQGIGGALLKESMRWLETTKPLITFADGKLTTFMPFINKYDWQFVESVAGIYRPGMRELCFNGGLTKQTDKLTTLVGFPTRARATDLEK